MTKKVFKSLPKLLDHQSIYWIVMHDLDPIFGWNISYQYPMNVVFDGEYINFVVKDYRIWKDPIGQPNLSKRYDNYKVRIHRKNIQRIDLYVSSYIR